jgi:hypothetical protein
MPVSQVFQVKKENQYVKNK